MRADRAWDRRKAPQAMRIDRWRSSPRREAGPSWLFTAFMAMGLAALVLFAAAVLVAHRPRPPRPLHELQLKLDPSHFLEPGPESRDPLDPVPPKWQSDSVDRIIEERSVK